MDKGLAGRNPGAKSLIRESPILMDPPMATAFPSEAEMKRFTNHEVSATEPILTAYFPIIPADIAVCIIEGAMDVRNPWTSGGAANPTAPKATVRTGGMDNPRNPGLDR